MKGWLYRRKNITWEFRAVGGKGWTSLDFLYAFTLCVKRTWGNSRSSVGYFILCMPTLRSSSEVQIQDLQLNTPGNISRSGPRLYLYNLSFSGLHVCTEHAWRPCSRVANTFPHAEQSLRRDSVLQGPMMGIKEWKRRYYYIFEKNLAYVDTPFPVSGVRCYFCWCCRRCRAKARTYGKVETMPVMTLSRCYYPTPRDIFCDQCDVKLGLFQKFRCFWRVAFVNVPPL